MGEQEGFSCQKSFLVVFHQNKQKQQQQKNTKQIITKSYRIFLLLFSGSDWALYIGLTVVGAICVALGAGLARGARKGRRLPPYSIARTGKSI